MLIPIATAGALACVLPPAVAALRILPAAQGHAVRWYLAGWIPAATAGALAAAAGEPGAPLAPAVLVATMLAAFAWALSVSSQSASERASQDAAHDKVVESARKYRHVYYSVPIALMSLDRQGNILRWNEMADRAFGTALVGGRLNPISQVLGKERTETLLQEGRQTGRHRCDLNSTWLANCGRTWSTRSQPAATSN